MAPATTRRRRRRTADLPDLVSASEAAVICGVKRVTFHRWRESGYFDIEPVTVASTPLWTRDDVERWAAVNGPRKPGPAPSSAAAAAA